MPCVYIPAKQIKNFRLCVFIFLARTASYSAGAVTFFKQRIKLTVTDWYKHSDSGSIVLSLFVTGE